jgi:hypothetical protein
MRKTCRVVVVNYVYRIVLCFLHFLKGILWENGDIYLLTYQCSVHEFRIVTQITVISFFLFCFNAVPFESGDMTFGGLSFISKIDTDLDRHVKIYR